MTLLNTLLNRYSSTTFQLAEHEIIIFPPNLFASLHAEETEEKNKDSLSTGEEGGANKEN